MKRKKIKKEIEILKRRKKVICDSAMIAAINNKGNDILDYYQGLIIEVNKQITELGKNVLNFISYDF